MTTSTPDRRAVAESWRLHPAWERVLLAVIVAILLAPGIGTLSGFGGEGAAAERHDAAAAVDDGSAWARWLAWPRAAATSFEEHFAFRDALVEAQAVVRYFALGVSPQPEVIRGRDGWLYYADDNGLDDILNERRFTNEELEAWAATLQHTQDWLAARGVAYVFTIAPDKPQIYPEFLPGSLRPRPGETRAYQLIAHLYAHTTVHVADPSLRLRTAKAVDRVYHRTDSHWNDLGAVVAARHLFATLDEVAPHLGVGPQALEPERFTRRERVTPAMDLARMLRLTGWLDETRLELVPTTPRVARVVEPVDGDPDFGEPRVVTERPDGRGPRALVYRDSFGSGLIPFLAESFSRAVFLWEYDVDPATVEAERPDVVIHEWTSRRLHTRPPYDAFAAIAPPRQQ